MNVLVLRSSRSVEAIEKIHEPKDNGGESLQHAASAHREDRKTILYSIIFYMAVRAPLGTTTIWFGGQDDIPCLSDMVCESEESTSRSTAKWC